MRLVLVPLDGSPLAEQALPVAAALAARAGASLDLVAVHQPAFPVAAGQGVPVLDQRLDAEAHAALQRYVDEARDRLQAERAAPAARAIVLDGDPADALAEHARRTAPDVIVMTTHARGGVRRLRLGGVTHALLRRAAVPVLVVHPREDGSPPPARGAFRRVVVALDDTPHGEAALAPALSLGDAGATEYALLHVVSPYHPTLRPVVPEASVERDLLDERRHAESYLGEVASRLRARALPARAEVRVAPDTADAIVAYATEIGADAIALATHGRGAVGRLLLGGVADDVLRAARVPVLLCPVAAAAPGDPLHAPSASRTAWGPAAS